MDLPKIRQKAVTVNLCFLPVHVCKLIKKSTIYTWGERLAWLTNTTELAPTATPKAPNMGRGRTGWGVGIEALGFPAGKEYKAIIISYGCYDLRKIFHSNYQQLLVTHLRPSNLASLYNDLWFSTKQSRIPQNQISQLSNLKNKKLMQNNNLL